MKRPMPAQPRTRVAAPSYPMALGLAALLATGCTGKQTTEIAPTGESKERSGGSRSHDPSEGEESDESAPSVDRAGKSASTHKSSKPKASASAPPEVPALGGAVAPAIEPAPSSSAAPPPPLPGGKVKAPYKKSDESM